MEDQVQIKMIPNEMLKIVPIFNGDKHQLNLFIRKCEYILNKYRGSDEQNLYVMYAITSRLVGDAAALFSEREDINSWEDFKELLIQHFGDPRSEECIAIELEGLRIRNNESYLDFCNRIQSVRSVLISKVNRLTDQNVKSSKIIIYNNTSLNVFLYNLPENMVRIVRLKAPSTLEEALSVVMEEVNFHEQYTLRNKMYGTSNNKPTPPSLPNNNPSFKFGTNNFNPIASMGHKPELNPNKFNFGLPQGLQPKLPQFNNNQQTFGYRPQPIGFRPQQFGISPQQFNMRPQQFNMRPQQFNMQPQTFNKPQQFGMRPQQFGNQQQNFYRPQQFGYKPQLNKNQYTGPSDVTMRTAPPLKTNQQGFQLNELDLDNTYYDNACGDVYPISYDNCCYEEYPSNGLNIPELSYYENEYPPIIPEVPHDVPTNMDDEDFQVEASDKSMKK